MPDLEPSTPASTKPSTHTLTSSTTDSIVTANDYPMIGRIPSPRRSYPKSRDSLSSNEESSITGSSFSSTHYERVLVSTESDSEHSFDCIPFTNSMSDYFDQFSQVLSKKAKSADHSGRIGIADTLTDMANILFDDDQYNAAYKVARRAQISYEMIVKDSMEGIASALLHHAEYHERQTDSAVLSEVYRSIANDLRRQPTPANLSKAFEVHSKHRIHGSSIPRIKLLNRLLDRRLKRSSEEVESLTRALKIQAQSKDLYFQTHTG